MLNIVSDPEDRASIWMRISDSLAVLFYDGHPLASLYYNELKVSDNVATTRGAGVKLASWKAWVRQITGKKKLPSDRVVSQETLNDELAANFFHHLTLIGNPLSDLIAARTLDAAAIRRKEQPIFKDWERNRMENTITFWERLRYGANEANLTSNRIESREMRKRAEVETEKREEAARAEKEKQQDAITEALAQNPNAEGPEDSHPADETTFSVPKNRDSHPADGM